MPKSTEQYRLLSDWEGRITHLLLTLGSQNLTYADVHNYLGNVFRAFADRSLLITVLSPTPLAGMRENSDNSGGPNVRIVDLSDGGRSRPDTSRWLQDQIAVTKNSGTGRICLTNSLADTDMAAAGMPTHFSVPLAAEQGYDHRTVEHKITGGEILCGGDYIFCGNDLLPKEDGRARTNHATRAATAESLRESLGVKHIVWIDRLMRRGLHAYSNLRRSAIKDDFGHIDMLITPGGPINGRPKTHLVFVAQVCREFCAPGQKKSLSKVFGRARVLDFIAEELAQTRCGNISFEVERLPMFVDARAKGVQFKSFNNVLLEVNGGERRVYVPDYVENPGMEGCMEAYLRTREVVHKVYTSHGFDVRFIAGHYSTMLGERGALRCASKVLDRNV